ncbi:hypothetical protein PsYK624_000580 [Phanerochaete sordida]|uniref:DUF6534 domain-containing protein n=1 Tax=Phanerochaete sordida TaxID=48140 RepID=A0A9P3FX72_9APHY|nr:hypothetical protein PsYK624_000580 [Phanerochaete sordida]
MTDAVVPMAACKNPLDQFIATILGLAFSWALWGAGTVQTFLYFSNYESDPWWLKAVVAAVWAIDTVTEALTLPAIFPLMATPTSLITTSIPPPMAMRTLLSYVVAAVVQLFFIYRIYRFSGKSLIVRICLALTLVLAAWQIIGVSVWAAWSISLPVAVYWRTRHVMYVSISTRAVSAFIDVLVAVWVAVLLQKKSHLLFGRSDRLVYRLTIMTINTGLWTAVFAVTDFSLIAWRASDLVFTVFEYPLGALYVNTLLANLNARNYMRGFMNANPCSGSPAPIQFAALDLQIGTSKSDDAGRASDEESAISAIETESRKGEAH